MAIHRPEDGSKSTTLDDQWGGLRDDLEDFLSQPAQYDILNIYGKI